MCNENLSNLQKMSENALITALLKIFTPDSLDELTRPFCERFKPECGEESDFNKQLTDLCVSAAKEGYYQGLGAASNILRMISSSKEDY